MKGAAIKHTTLHVDGDAGAKSSERSGGDESEAYLTTQILTYLGNKRSLLSFIGDAVNTVKKSLGKDRISFFDAFSGSGVVSRFMKKHSSLVIANDLELYSEIENKCYLTNQSSIDTLEFDHVFDEWVAYTRKHV